MEVTFLKNFQMKFLVDAVLEASSILDQNI